MTPPPKEFPCLSLPQTHQNARFTPTSSQSPGRCCLLTGLVTMQISGFFVQFIPSSCLRFIALILLESPGAMNVSQSSPSWVMLNPFVDVSSQPTSTKVGFLCSTVGQVLRTLCFAVARALFAGAAPCRCQEMIAPTFAGTTSQSSPPVLISKLPAAPS